MGIYEVEIEAGVKVKAKLIDNNSLLNENICKLRSLLQTSVVGLDVKLQPSIWPWMSNTPQMLLLCIANYCLIIQLDKFDAFPENLKIFLADEEICFVGKELSQKLSSLSKNVTCKTGVEVGDLAARVLKKPYISTCGLTYLAIEAGVSQTVAAAAFSAAVKGQAPVDWSAKAFTDEEIKFAIQEAYACYAIGNKLLRML